MSRSIYATSPQAEQNLVGRLDRSAQRAEARAKLYSGIQQQHLALLNSGIHPSKLPTISADMSPADLVTAQKSMSRMGPAPSSLPTPVRATTPTLFQPTGGDPAMPTADARKLLDFRNKTDSATNEKVAAAAGAGTQVQTQYGTVSSSKAIPGAIPAPPIFSDTGIVHPPSHSETWAANHGADWQAKLIEKYPAIGQKGTPENLAFLNSVRTLGDKAGASSPFDLARGAVASLQSGPGADDSGAEGPVGPKSPPPAKGALAVGRAVNAGAGDAVNSFGGGIINNVVRPMYNTGVDVANGVRGMFGADTSLPKMAPYVAPPNSLDASMAAGEKAGRMFPATPAPVAPDNSVADQRALNASRISENAGGDAFRIASGAAPFPAPVPQTPRAAASDADYDASVDGGSGRPIAPPAPFGISHGPMFDGETGATGATGTEGSASTPLGSTAMTESPLAAFAASPEDAEFKKRLTTTAQNFPGR